MSKEECTLLQFEVGRGFLLVASAFLAELKSQWIFPVLDEIKHNILVVLHIPFFN